MHSEPHQGGMYRRIPLPREQRGGLFCLFSLDQYNNTPCGCDFPHQSSSWSPCVYESRLQKHFRVTFEANPNHIQEIIQINITATRWGLTFLPVGLFSYLKRTRFPLWRRCTCYSHLFFLFLAAVTARSCPPPWTTMQCKSPSLCGTKPALYSQREFLLF